MLFISPEMYLSFILRVIEFSYFCVYSVIRMHLQLMLSVFNKWLCQFDFSMENPFFPIIWQVTCQLCQIVCSEELILCRR